MRIPPDTLFSSLRAELESTGGLRRGKLDFDQLARSRDARWRAEGSITLLEVMEGYCLGVKWPVFWRYLEFLPNTKFLVCLRDPYEVVASFKRVGGRLGEGLDYDIAFNRTMNDELRRATTDLAARRALLCEYVLSRIVPFLSRPNVLVVKYERWFSEPDAVIDDVGRFLGVRLEDQQVRIRPPESVDPLSPRERSLVRELCPSAEAVGYAL
jgi:hypothetical protein